MTTHKQQALYTKLLRKLGPLSPASEFETLERRFSLMSVAEGSLAIQKVNALLGFDKDTSTCTDMQLAFIRDLEAKLELEPHEVTDGPRLSYAEADARIRILKADVVRYDAMMTKIMAKIEAEAHAAAEVES